MIKLHVQMLYRYMYMFLYILLVFELSRFLCIFASLQHDLFTCVHKHYSVDEWTSFASKHPEVLGNIAISSGSGQEDYLKLKEIVSRVPTVKYICLDVANGYSEHFVTLVRQARKDFPEHSIMVSRRPLNIHIVM